MKPTHKKKPKPPETPELDITLQDPRWQKVLPDYEPFIFELVSRTLEAVLENMPMPPVELSIVLANDTFIQDLNKTHRGMDKPTNVLAFPNLTEVQTTLESFAKGQPPLGLGDIVLAFETIKTEAQQQGKQFTHHLSHLLIHGVLHLLGYDHQNPEQADEMESLEIELLKQRGIPNPYEPTPKPEENLRADHP